jgi:phenazine biosynthesis protein phzE
MNPLHQLLTEPDPGPFALLHREGRDHLELLRGTLRVVDKLADIPLPAGTGEHTLALVPFRQLAERGFDCIDDGTPLTCLSIQSYQQIPLAEAIEALPTHTPRVTDRGFDIADADYEKIVARVLDEEIGRGEGSNFVIHRTLHATAHDAPLTVAASALRRLLLGEQGVYWTFLVHLPGQSQGPDATAGVEGRTLVGATPERHVSVDDGLAMMNPISGTFRHGTDPAGPDRAELLRFLADPKEINELSMVLDEELKMMAVVADRGGQVIGPYLKQMSQLTHTEYLLA